MKRTSPLFNIEKRSEDGIDYHEVTIKITFTPDNPFKDMETEAEKCNFIAEVLSPSDNATYVTLDENFNTVGSDEDEN